MPKVASSKTSKKVYDREDLEKMNRAQIQATAKAWNVKANMKTTEIIKHLLLEMGSPLGATGDEVQETAQLARTASGTSPNAIRCSNPAVKVEQDNSPRTPLRVHHSVSRRADDSMNATREWQRQLLVWNQPPPVGAPEPRTPPPPASRIQARSGHIISPHPNHALVVRSNVRRFSEPVPWPRESPPLRNATLQPVATPSTPSDVPLPDPQQMPTATGARPLAGYEVRRVLRHMKRLVDQQTAEKAEATSIVNFRRFLQNESDEITQKVDELAWGYAAIEKAVVDVMKSDPTLVDGTELMVNARNKANWLKYMRANYVPIDTRVDERQAMIDDEVEEQECDKENPREPTTSGSAFHCEPQTFGSASRLLPAASTSYRSQPQGFVYDADDDMSD